jgi:glyoxylase-like metal-dependent hydrolase (beta-lactamase superfamily II)
MLRLEPAPGHTPGSSVAWLETGRGAVFVGDLMHTPVPIARPDDACAFDLDPEAGRAWRRNVLRAAALFPAHFAGHGGTSIAAQDATDFTVDKWADFTAI